MPASEDMPNSVNEGINDGGGEEGSTIEKARIALSGRIWSASDKESHSAFQPIYSAENPSIILPRPAVPDHLRVFVQHNTIPNADDLGRPAKQQVEPGAFDQTAYIQGTEEFNIWYGKAPTTAGDFFNRRNREPAPGRCNPFTDTGWTQATKETMKDASIVIPFCLFFAKGVCSYGSTCKYHHRVPTEEDDSKLAPVNDVFGRERHQTHRDDMDGVGSFQMDCRNLFVGDLIFDRTDPNYVQSMVNVLFKHFSLWGSLENVKVIPNKAIAFLRYKTRVAAEFAKVAMAEQSLGKNGNQICVRWAHPDRNPRAQEEIAQRDWNFTKMKVEDRLQQLKLPENTLLKYRHLMAHDQQGTVGKSALAAPYGDNEGKSESLANNDVKLHEEALLALVKEEKLERDAAIEAAHARMNSIIGGASVGAEEDFECQI
eukprot:GHVH01004929.1.p1 GENE.GHVH01004929.1~~GHVH01004929.1.p1  ORF type:complete len:429 (+),score=65.58 GHVH01004929.1:445-1731(+)